MKIESGAVDYVSGGGSGIGRGIAMNLAELGVRVGAVISSKLMLLKPSL